MQGDQDRQQVALSVNEVMEGFMEESWGQKERKNENLPSGHAKKRTAKNTPLKRNTKIKTIQKHGQFEDLRADQDKNRTTRYSAAQHSKLYQLGLGRITGEGSFSQQATFQSQWSGVTSQKGNRARETPREGRINEGADVTR